MPLPVYRTQVSCWGKKMALELTGKTITDPLYGNINLTKIESRLVSTPVFQRLHNIRQLGLGHLVFPSAGYSRFAHSVGACHNADRILTAIEANSEHKIFTDIERQAFRIAALFHDLGHYPFSHTTEHAVKRFFREGIYSTPDDKQGVLDIAVSPSAAPTYLDHEDTGQLIFLDDPEISEIFEEDAMMSKSDVTASFLDENLSTIISSDLDCDRLDYLKRTSIHSGAPYGAVDVDFIISKATIDGDGRFCFDRKAVRAADHLLVSRFYDFMQIPYHKTVAALEWSLEESVIFLLRIGVLKLSEAEMKAKLLSSEWADFDDGAMINLMRASLTEISDPVALDHLNAVLKRRPAKMVYSWECLVDYGNNEQETLEKLLNYKIDSISKEMGIDRRRFTIWKAPFKLSKAGPILQGSPADRDYSEEEQQQLIHVLEKGKTKSIPLIDMNNTLSHNLAKLRFRVLRVYYLPSATDNVTIKHELRTAFESI